MTVNLKSDEVRVKWRDMLDRVFVDHQEIVVERYNRPIVVMVNYDQWQMVTRQRREYLENLSQEAKAGDFYTQEQVEEGLRERGLL